MRRTLLAILVLGILSAPAEDAPFRLSSLQWKHRVLLVFAPSEQHPAFVRQQQEWTRAMDGMDERDVLLIPLVHRSSTRVADRIISPEDQTALRHELRVSSDDFAVLLIGRDGGVKLRQQEPVEALRLFALIDSMPMRRQEMRRQTK